MAWRYKLNLNQVGNAFLLSSVVGDIPINQHFKDWSPETVSAPLWYYKDKKNAIKIILSSTNGVRKIWFSGIAYSSCPDKIKLMMNIDNYYQHLELDNNPITGSTKIKYSLEEYKLYLLSRYSYHIRGDKAKMASLDFASSFPLIIDSYNENRR